VKHLVSLHDLHASDVAELLELALQLKARHRRGMHEGVLVGKLLGLIFEKSSTRTRFSFEAAMAHLGGSSIFVDTAGQDFTAREPLCDLARVYSGYCNALVLRTHAHETMVEMARHGTIPVINGLSDKLHPCQALADLLTVREIFGTIAGVTIAYIGDANNVARSLAYGCALTGAKLRAASPPGYAFTAEFLATVSGRGTVEALDDPAEAVHGARVVYTDVWASMGQEDEADERKKAFANYQVTPQLMEKAEPDAVFMHCLPAHRGEEVHPDVIEGSRSVAFHQAENRLHAQKAVLWKLMT
jgi:ornithine carbamoyltransferase